MKLEVKVPAVGESVTEAIIGSWTKKSGDFVKMNEVLMLLETDKASVEVVAEKDGVLTISTPAGETVLIGAVVGVIDTDGKASASADSAAATPVTSAAATTSTNTTAPTSQPATLP